MLSLMSLSLAGSMNGGNKHDNGDEKQDEGKSSKENGHVYHSGVSFGDSIMTVDRFETGLSLVILLL